MKKLLSIVLALCMALSLCVTTWADENSFDVTTVEELANAITSSSSATTTVINIKNDLDFGSATWNPDIAHGDMVIDGGTGVMLKNLSSMFIKENKDGQTVTIKNVTIDNATINASELGVAAFIGYADNTGSLTFENCKLTKSTVMNTSGYAGGFVGYATGGSPNHRTITFTNCQVLNCQITGSNSTGGLMGHAIGNANLSVVVTNATVKGNTITCTDDSNVKAGSLFGTASTAEDDVTLSVSANVSGNTVKSGDDTTGVATITTIYGRQVNDKTTLTLTGGSYDNAPLGAGDDWADYAANTPVAIGDDNYYYVGSDSIVAAVKAGTVVEVIVGGAIEGLPYGIVVTVEEGEDEPEEYALFVNDEAGDKTTLNGTSALGGSYYVLTDPPAEPAHSHTRRQPTTTVVTPDTTTTDTVTSAKTFDAGIAVYAAMGVLSLTGSAWIVGKKRG